MTGRRGFLGAILGLAAAPAVVAASSIMRVKPVVESGVLTYKALDRYDLNPDSLERMMIEIRNSGTIRPTKLIVPSAMIAQCEIILNQCFDAEYAKYKGLV